MRLMQLLKKIFLPSYTDKKVDQISELNQRKMEEVAKELKVHNDAAMKFYIAMGGKNGH